MTAPASRPRAAGPRRSTPPAAPCAPPPAASPAILLPALLGALLAVGSAGCTNPENVVPEDAAPQAAPAPEAEIPLEEEENHLQVTLYFLSRDGETLAGEPRRIFKTATTTDRARQAVQALLDGPEGPLMRSIPPGTRLQEIFITSDGTAYVDLGPEFRWGIETGSSDAVFAVYSLVNTLAGNFEEIRQVKLLLDGDEAQSVGGHLDLSRPILPEMSLVARR